MLKEYYKCQNYPFKVHLEQIKMMDNVVIKHK